MEHQGYLRGLGLALCFLMPIVIPAPSAGEAGKTAAAFLKIPVGARATGMAGAFTALADDPTAPYWNPAGLAWLTDKRFALVHNSWLMDFNHEYVSYAQPLGSWGGLSISALGLLSGSIDRCTSPDCGDEGTFAALDGCLSASFAARMGALAVGVSAKGLVSQIDEEKRYGACGDAGLLWRQDRDTGPSLAVAIKNLGQDMKMLDTRSPLPSSGVAAGAWRLGLGSVRLSMAGEYEVLRYGSERVRAGVELELPVLSLRGGYRRILSEQPDDEALTGPTFGFGVRYRGMFIDASYAELGGSLGSNVLVGLSLSL